MEKKRRNSLDDINKTGKVSSEARRIFRELTEDDEIGGGKGAIFGLHPVARVIASFFIGSHNKNQRFFKAREEAMVWLGERDMNVSESEKQTQNNPGDFRICPWR